MTSGPEGGKVLVLDGDAAHSKAVLLALRGAAKVDHLSELGEVPKGQTWDLLLADYDSLRHQETRLLEVFPTLCAMGRLVLYSTRCDRAVLGRLFQEIGLTHFMAYSGAVNTETLQVTVKKLLTGDIFGIQKYFLDDALTATLSISSSASKDEVLAQAARFAAKANLTHRMNNQFCTVVDELTTNALYNAPLDAAGQPRFAHYPRTKSVELDPAQEAKIAFLCDGRRIGVAVTDPFGSLHPDKILGYLSKCFRKGEDQIDEKEGGAGLGLYYVFEALSHLIVNLRYGHRTEVIGLLEIRGNYREFASRGKSLDIFVVGDK